MNWYVDAGLPGEARQALKSLDSVFALEGAQVAQAPLSRVIRVSIGENYYYVKCYVGERVGVWRNWLGLRALVAPVRVQKEWENLMLFQRWGIPTAQLAAFGMTQRWGRFVKGALVTRELRGAMDLAAIAYANDTRLADRLWVRSVSKQLAESVRIMHSRRFAHNDLKWRNILVEDGQAPVLYFIDCPAGRFWWGPFFEYRRIKDLACLDKVAKVYLSRTQRLRFYLDYVQHQNLTLKDKSVIRKIGILVERYE